MSQPPRDIIFIPQSRDPSDVLSETSIGSKPGIDATKKIPGEGHKARLAALNSNG